MFHLMTSNVKDAGVKTGNAGITPWNAGFINALKKKICTIVPSVEIFPVTISIPTGSSRKNGIILKYIISAGYRNSGLRNGRKRKPGESWINIFMAHGHYK